MTAVEWFIKQLPLIQQEGLRDVIEEAKEMEKQQIMNAYGIKTFRTIKMGLDVYEQINGEQYYNETYKSTKK
jgi:hypothetical protein